MKTKLREITIVVIVLTLLSLCFATWDNDKPGDDDAWNDAAGDIRANWDALETAFGVNLADVTALSIINVQNSTYGAEGDGSTDDTTAIQAAIDAANSGTIKRVYFPAGSSYYKITSELTLYGGIEYFGDGIGSQIRQATSNTNVLAAATQDNICIHDLYLYGPGDTDAGDNGHGVYLSNCDYAKVYNLKCENMGLNGITLANSDYGWVKNNLITTSGKDSTSSSAIFVGYSSSYNVIENNTIINDKHGIMVQTVNTADYASYNVVNGNIIKTCDRYGIIIYNNNGDGYVYGNRIIGNNIRDISDAATDTFGAGIYCVGTKWTTIADNYVENTNQGTTADTLAPGGVGIADSAYCSIVGNTIENAQYYGITVRDATPLGAHHTISGNTVSTSTKAGIYALTISNVTITGNTVFGGSAQGIYAKSAADHEHLIITNNVCTDNNTQQIDVDGFNRVRIANNIASDSDTTHGINLANSDYATIVENECSDNAVRGISIASTNTYVTAHKNTCVGNDYGIVLGAVGDIVDFKDNTVTGNTTGNWTNGPYATFTDEDATPSVKGGRLFKTNTTGVTITQFDDGVEGEELIILSQGAIVYDTSTATRLIGSTGDVTTANGDYTWWFCETGGTASSVWRIKGFVDISIDNSGQI